MSGSRSFRPESGAGMNSDMVEEIKAQFRDRVRAQGGGATNTPRAEVVGSNVSNSESDEAATVAARNLLFELASKQAAEKAAEADAELEGKTSVRYTGTQDGNMLEIGEHRLFFNLPIKSPDELIGVAARNFARSLSKEGLSADEIYTIIGPQVDSWRHGEMGEGGEDYAVKESVRAFASWKKSVQAPSAVPQSRLRKFFSFGSAK